jgi:hypothetical protein
MGGKWLSVFYPNHQQTIKCRDKADTIRAIQMRRSDGKKKSAKGGGR